MAVTQQNLGSTTQGNMVVNTLTNDTYQQSEGGRVGQQLDEHDHSNAKGLAVKRIQSGLDAGKPTGGTAAGTVYVATDTGIVYYDDGTDLDVLATLDNAQTWTATQTFSALWSDAAQVSVASAATFALPTTGNNVNVTGTTGITDFSGPATQGVIYKLQFTNATPGAVTSGNHAKLNGNFTTAQNNILYLYWDGTNAWEIGRYTGASLAAATTFLGADVLLNNTGSYFAGPNTGSIGGAGQKWLLIGIACFVDTTQLARFEMQLTDGSTVFAESPTVSSGASNEISLTLAVVIAPAAAATYTLNARDSNTASGKLMTSGSGVTQANKATSITAIRLS